jgi:2-dehydro-3-deoxy-D-arabinonate dehydratase
VTEPLLTRHSYRGLTRWAVDGRLLPAGVGLGSLLELRADHVPGALDALALDETAGGGLLAPVDPDHEVWAAGVTYMRSRAAREAESRTSGSSDIYTRVYEADRPELFFKCPGRRAVGPGGEIRARADARWSVPEPEMTVVVNRHAEVVGYCAGNDVSARDIEGDNPLYLPQAKAYDGSCALGPGIVITPNSDLGSIEVRLDIVRGDRTVFSGATKTSEMKRTLVELIDHLGAELSFPHGVLLMTGTSIVPSDDYTLRPGDEIIVGVGALDLRNTVAAAGAGGASQ